MKKWLAAILSMIIIGFAGYQFYEYKYASGSDKSNAKTSGQAPGKITTGIDTEMINASKSLEVDLQKESSGRTIENPYIKVDPYGSSPLSALVIFDTDEASQVSFTVKGKDKEVNISKTIDGFSTHHELPVLGLYPNKKNTLEITATAKSGKVTTKMVSIQTKKLPDYIPKVTIKKINKEKMETIENGLTFAVPSTKYAIGFDRNGDIRWYRSRYSSHVFKTLSNGHMLILGKDKNSGTAYNRLYETDFIGKIYNVYTIGMNNAVSEQVGGEKTIVHHDAIELPSGNLLLTVNDGSGVYMEDTMIEIDRTSGKLVKEIDLKDILPDSFYKNYKSTKREDGLVDWFHQNAIVYDYRDNSIIISGRNQDTVMKLDYQTKKIVWILSDKTGWPKSYQKYLIKGTGKNFKFTGGQHAPIIIPESAADNDENTIDLLLFDNNVTVTRGNKELSTKYSAGSQYRINEKTKTAELVWTYGAERGQTMFSNIIGSDRFMPTTGNRLIDFGWLDSGKKSEIVEVDSKNNANVVFEAQLSDFPTGSWAYRAERMSLYP